LAGAIDKATLAFAYIWLNKNDKYNGYLFHCQLCAIKDLERFAFFPNSACPNYYFLVSNDHGIHNWQDKKQH